MAARRVRRKSRAELKAELMVYFEQKADELLDWREEQGATDLWTIEELVEQAGRAVQGRLVETLVESQQRGLSVSEMCPTCGRQLDYWGERWRGVETNVGADQPQSAVLLLSPLSGGFFPLRTSY